MSVDDEAQSLLVLEKVVAPRNVHEISQVRSEHRQLTAEMQHQHRQKCIEGRVTDSREDRSQELADPRDLIIGTLFGVVREDGRMQKTPEIGFRRVLHVAPDLERDKGREHRVRESGTHDGYQTAQPGVLQHRPSVHFRYRFRPVVQYLTDQ